MKTYNLGPSVEAYLALEEAASDLHEFLMAHAIGEAYRIPLFRDDGEADTPGLTSYVSSAPVEVEKLSGDTGLRSAAGIYKQFVRRKNQPPRSADRLPGVIALRSVADGRTARALADKVNQLKSSLKHEVGLLPSVKGRGSDLFAGTELQHVFLVQAYRHISIAPDGVDRISFCWDRRNRVINRVPRAALIDRLLERSDAGVSKWVNRLRERADEFVAVARDRGPVPCVFVRRDEQWLPRLTASMPILVTGGTGFELSPLESYFPPVENTDRRPPNPGKRPLAAFPVIPELGVYEYE